MLDLDDFLNYFSSNYMNFTVSSKVISVNLPIISNESLKNDIKFIVKCNKSLAEYTIRKQN